MDTYGSFRNRGLSVDTSYDAPPKYPLPLLRLEGFIWLSISAVCLGLGNSLEPVSPLAYLHTFFLLVGFSKFAISTNWMIASMATLFIEALGMTLGFVTLFHYQNSIGESFGYAFAFGLLIWFVIILLALIPHHFFLYRFPASPIVPFIYPIAMTAVIHGIFGPTLSVLPSLTNAVIDYAPMRQLSALIGSAGINFVTVSFGSIAAFTFIRNKIQDYNKIISFSSISVLALIIVTSFLIQTDKLYQQDISTQIKPTINVSCIFGQGIQIGGNTWDQVWDTTNTRILAGDQIILWSETMFIVKSDNDLHILLNKAKTILSETNTTYLGLTYLYQFDKYKTNNFLLLNPIGEIVWNYEKSHPVPIIESDVRPGRDFIPTHNSPYGKLGGAICFDLDYPQFIHKASVAKVDIFLQPSWTWGAIGDRHFDGDALRAIENGFTLFRCSSDGVSGIVSPRGIVWSRAYTGHDPSVATHFTLPLWPRISTMFTAIGFIFEYICLGLTFLILLITFLPEKIVVQTLSYLNIQSYSTRTDSQGQDLGVV